MEQIDEVLIAGFGLKRHAVGDIPGVQVQGCHGIWCQVQATIIRHKQDCSSSVVCFLLTVVSNLSHVVGVVVHA